MGLLYLTHASALLAAGEQGWVSSFLAAVFDPAWNLDHRGMIWGVIVVVLFLSGVGLPLPEDVPLTMAGFTTYKQAGDVFIWSHFLLAFGVVVVPILLGDVLAYVLGREFGFGLRDRFGLLRRALSDVRMARVQRWFDNYGSFTVFLGRQMAGVRFVTFFSAGTMRVPLPKFVFFDFLGCLVSVPVWLTLGVMASRYGQTWLEWALRIVGGGFFVATIVVFLAFFAVVRWRSAARRQNNALR